MSNKGWRSLVAVFLDRLKVRLVGFTPDEMEKPDYAVHTIQVLFEFVKGSLTDVEESANRALAESEGKVLGVDIRRYGSRSVSGELLEVKHAQGETYILAFNYKVPLPQPIALKGEPRVKLLQHEKLAELAKLVNSFAAQHAVTGANLGFHGHRVTSESGVWFIQVNYLV